MNISRDNIDDLTSIIRIHIEPADYQGKVENALLDYRKKVRLDGFRPGKVPAGIMKKIYGKSIQAEEVQRLLSDTLNNFIKENELRLLGEPIPNEESPEIDWENQDTYDFNFDIAVAPEVEIKLGNRDKINDYKVIVTGDMVDKQVEDYARRFGTFEPTDTASEEDVLKGDLCEIAGEHDHEHEHDREHGLEHHHEHDHHHAVHAHGTMVYIKSIADETIKNQLIGTKVNDVVVFNPNIAFPNETDRAALLKVDKEDLADINGDFEFTISEISHFIPAEIDQVLFDKCFGEGKIDSIESFRNRIREDITGHFARDSRYKAHLDIKEILLSKTEIPLPEEFLKRWMLLTSKDKNLTKEQLNIEFPAFADDLRWRMIKNNIINEQNLEASEDEIREQSIWTAKSRYNQYGIYDVPLEQLFRFADTLLKNEEEKSRIADVILENKVIDHVKTLINLEEKEVNVEEFYKLFD